MPALPGRETKLLYRGITKEPGRLGCCLLSCWYSFQAPNSRYFLSEYSFTGYLVPNTGIRLGFLKSLPHLAPASLAFPTISFLPAALLLLPWLPHLKWGYLSVHCLMSSWLFLFTLPSISILTPLLGKHLHSYFLGVIFSFLIVLFNCFETPASSQRKNPGSQHRCQPWRTLPGHSTPGISETLQWIWNAAVSVATI